MPLLINYVVRLFFRDSFVRPSTQPVPTAQKTPSRSPTKKLMLASLAALASIHSASPIQLKSDRQFRKDIQRYKSPLGGLNTTKLSLSTSKNAVHKALITKLNTDTIAFNECLDSKLPVISCVVDSGASFTSVNDETLVVPGSMTLLDNPIELDGIAGGFVVEHKCQIQFECVDIDGEPLSRTTEAYYHPELPCMLMSPQAFLQHQFIQKLTTEEINTLVEDHFTIYRDRVEWHADGKHLLTIDYDSSFLPRLQ